LSEEISYWNTTGLSDGTYSLRLKVNGDDNKKAINRVQIDNAPKAPLNLTVTDTPFDGGGSLTLNWNKSPDDGGGNNDVTGYKIYKSTFQGGFSFLAQTAAGTVSYIDTNCTTQVTYYFVLTSLDNISESDYSNTASGYSLVDGVEIDPETGGTVRLDINGSVTEISIEPGSVESRVWMGIKRPDTYPDTGIPKSARKTEIVREFGVTPAGTKFLKPVTIKIPYSSAEIPGMNRENLRIYWWDENKLEWRIVNTSDPNSENGRVWARIPHFSTYRIMEYAPGQEELLSNESVYTYPNPATGDKVFFKYYLGDKADIKIDVYNVAGELVSTIERSANPAGIVSETEWNISGTASGVYVYRLETKSDSKTKAVKKKMAIIH